jgi:hypothetical protein
VRWQRREVRFGRLRLVPPRLLLRRRSSLHAVKSGCPNHHNEAIALECPSSGAASQESHCPLISHLRHASVAARSAGAAARKAAVDQILTLVHTLTCCARGRDPRTRALPHRACCPSGQALHLLR